MPIRTLFFVVTLEYFSGIICCSYHSITSSRCGVVVKISASVNWLKENGSKKVGMVGYCMGSALAIGVLPCSTSTLF